MSPSLTRGGGNGARIFWAPGIEFSIEKKGYRGTRKVLTEDSYNFHIGPHFSAQFSPRISGPPHDSFYEIMAQ